MSNLTQRILVAIVAIPIVIFIVMSKPIGLLTMLVMLSALTVNEYYGLAKAKGFLVQATAGMTITGLIVLSFAQVRLLSFFHRSEMASTFDPLVAILILGVIVTSVTELYRNVPNPLNNVAITLGGALYIGLGLGAFFGMREYFILKAGVDHAALSMDPGLFCVIFLCSIWACDSAALFGGRAMGKHKLFERVSPKKTWEGSIWGALFAFLTWFAARAIFADLAALTIVDCIIFGLIVGVFGQLGDLSKSILKRDAGVKDSSNLIPGHGGVLDRLDSILFGAPLIYLYLHIFGI
jgi:phosphatidate cytidylyltransferase